MKKLTTLLLALPFFCSAQTFNADKIGQTKFQKEGDMPVAIKGGYIGLDMDYSIRFGVTAKLSKMNYYTKLQRYDDAFTVVKDNKLTSDDNKFGPFPPSLVEADGKVYLVYFQMKDDEMDINAAEIDAETLTLKTVKKLMGINQKDVGLSKMADISSNYKFEIEHSADDKKFVLLWSSGADNSFSYVVTNNNFDVIRTKTETIGDGKDAHLGNVMVDNDAGIFAEFYTESRSSRTQYVFSNSSADKSFSAALNVDKYPAVMYAYFFPAGANDQVQLCGVYSDDFDYLTGSFSQTFSKKDMTVLKTNTSDFSEELVERFKKDGAAKAKKNKFGLFKEIDFKLLSVKSVNYMAGDLTYYRANAQFTTVIKTSALVLIFDKDNIVNTRLPKPTVIGSTLSRNILFPYKDKALLFYIDNEQNAAQPLETPGTDDCSRCNYYLYGATISKEGIISRKTVSMAGESNVTFSTPVRKITDNSFLFSFMRTKANMVQYISSYVTYKMNINE